MEQVGRVRAGIDHRPERHHRIFAAFGGDELGSEQRVAQDVVVDLEPKTCGLSQVPTVDGELTGIRGQHTSTWHLSPRHLKHLPELGGVGPRLHDLMGSLVVGIGPAVVLRLLFNRRPVLASANNASPTHHEHEVFEQLLHSELIARCFVAQAVAGRSAHQLADGFGHLGKGKPGIVGAGHFWCVTHVGIIPLKSGQEVSSLFAILEIMRADRLIAALLVLQQRGKVTARELAEELEVSERTARRDLEALAISGVPVYSTAGRSGGWQLIGEAKTDLTGLSSSEARALFVAVGRSIGDGGDDGNPAELRSALRKLTGALPEPFRDEASLATSAIKIDARGWGQVEQTPAPPFLDQLTDAVLSSSQIEIDYVNASGDRGLREVDPLGLVTKRGVWYLVANTPRGVRTYRVERVAGLRLLDGKVERPADFDLDEEWSRIVTEVEARRMGLQVRARVDPAAMRAIRWQFRSQYEELGTLADGRIEVRIEEYNERSFAAQIAGYGKRVELIDPPPGVVAEMERLIDELSELYAGSSAP